MPKNDCQSVLIERFLIREKHVNSVAQNMAEAVEAHFSKRLQLTVNSEPFFHSNITIQ
jgi:hypothetical protein